MTDSTTSTAPALDHRGLRALFINTTLKKSPEISQTQALIDQSARIMRQQGVDVDVLRSIDHDIAQGVYPDMREHGWERDEWPQLRERVEAADILVIAGPIWLGDQSSEARKIIERLYAINSDVRDDGQYLFTGKVGGALATGNDDGYKHVAAYWTWSLAHMSVTIPPNADAAWTGPAGPGPSYLDPGSGGPENDFTNRTLTFLTWNLMHCAAILRAAGGYPRWGNLPGAWEDGERFGFVPLAGADAAGAN